VTVREFPALFGRPPAPICKWRPPTQRDPAYVAARRAWPVGCRANSVDCSRARAHGRDIEQVRLLFDAVHFRCAIASKGGSELAASTSAWASTCDSFWSSPAATGNRNRRERGHPRHRSLTCANVDTHDIRVRCIDERDRARVKANSLASSYPKQPVAVDLLQSKRARRASAGCGIDLPEFVRRARRPSGLF